MIKNIALTFLALSLLTCASQGSKKSIIKGELPAKWDIAFYNVENLFDVEDDSGKDDEDFTPTGQNEWTQGRLETKVKNLAKVFQAMGGSQEPPLIIGLAEVENESVVELLAKTIKPNAYAIVHQDSPDNRGIDVALLYDESQFKLKSKDFLRIDFAEKDYTSREILYAQLSSYATGEELHIFVNHWPSRRGGENETEQRRMDAANTLKKKVDEVQAAHADAQIIIMGDFNDYPNNRSLVNSLGAVAKDNESENELVNLAYTLEEANKGTYNYKGDWGMLDQIIISDVLFKEAGISTHQGALDIFQKDFMMYYDKNAGEALPNKTYGGGGKYYGGYSDHLPIRLTMTTTH